MRIRFSLSSVGSAFAGLALLCMVGCQHEPTDEELIQKEKASGTIVMPPKAKTSETTPPTAKKPLEAPAKPKSVVATPSKAPAPAKDGP